MSNTLDIKSIGALLDYKFSIPSYQRGYRWKSFQVNALLKDIWDYKIDSSKPESFYCLQPIVIKESNGKFELIDGQQRLTTIVLILHYFNTYEFKIPKKHFTLTFDTRITQNNFLDVIEDKQVCIDNIDLSHLYDAFEIIKLWFEEKEKELPSVKGDFHSKLINKTKVIEYEIKDDSSVIEIFTRLNIGKIPLTNAELIKALFLSKSSSLNDENKYLKQIGIATEWDRIEATLQKPEFWYFINTNKIPYETRIEFIFDLIKNKKTDDEQYFTFYEFNEEFEKNGNKHSTISKIWLDIKKYFLTLEEWFNDKEYYHFVGYLVAVGFGIKDIKKLSVGVSKEEFREKLRKMARDTISKELKDLNYDDNKTDIRRALLFFNILSIINSREKILRFPFNYFHLQQWDLEHIRSQTSKDIQGKDRLNWANSVLDYFTGLEFDGLNENVIIDLIKSLNLEEQDYCFRLLIIIKEEDKNDSVFNKLVEDLSLYFKEDALIDDGDNLSNLTLLDASTNRRYGNSFFPVKRKHILKQEMEGVFIPLCTKNVFLKAYSKKLGEIMYWNNNDCNDYLNEIIKIMN
jgi:hypothetical protein